MREMWAPVGYLQIVLDCKSRADADSMKKIEVVRSSELKAGYSTPGIVREKAFESMHRYIIVSRTRVTGGAMSGWHHHGTRHLYAFVEAGRMRLQYGPKGARAVEVSRGDFFHIPP